MAIKRTTKADAGFSMSSMTDIVFLLLIFFLVTSTLINPNALKLELPKSSNQLKDKAITTVSIEQKGAEYIYYVELDKVAGIEGIERALKARLEGQEQPTVSLHCDKKVAVDEVVKVMNIAKDNGYRLILATQAK